MRRHEHLLLDGTFPAFSLRQIIEQPSDAMRLQTMLNFFDDSDMSRTGVVLKRGYKKARGPSSELAGWQVTVMQCNAAPAMLTP